ncbi:IS630 transposase-related protein [Thermosynechococcus sp.]|uniref:IS630 transposase-related protein n=1 Tax=Thermosynechococcus sp. TaxID=2814275 RepID=UPI0037DC00CD
MFLAVYPWADLSPKFAAGKQRDREPDLCQGKLDWQTLGPDVAPHPEDPLIDRAQQFGVQISTISSALGRLAITRKNRCPTKNALWKSDSGCMQGPKVLLRR